MKKFNRNWITFPLFLLLSFFLYSFINQNDNSKNYSPDNDDSLKINQPKIDVKVNKKFDEKGNMIQYDSSYSIIYSSPGTDIQFYNLDNDSIFSQFKNSMQENDFFKHFPDMDFQNDFFKMDTWDNMKRMQEMMNKMFPDFNRDTLLIKPQKNKAPTEENKSENMITL